MRIIKVYGDSDYGAVDFEHFVEDNKLSFDEAKKLTEVKQAYEEYITPLTIEEVELDISQEAILWLHKEILDEDDLKHTGFYSEEDELFKHDK